MFCFDQIEHFFPNHNTVVENLLWLCFLFIVIFFSFIAILMIKYLLWLIFIITKEKLHHLPSKNVVIIYFETNNYCKLLEIVFGHGNII